MRVASQGEAEEGASSEGHSSTLQGASVDDYTLQDGEKDTTYHRNISAQQSVRRGVDIMIRGADKVKVWAEIGKELCEFIIDLLNFGEDREERQVVSKKKKSVAKTARRKRA